MIIMMIIIVVTPELLLQIHLPGLLGLDLLDLQPTALRHPTKLQRGLLHQAEPRVANAQGTAWLTCNIAWAAAAVATPRS